MGNRRIVRPAVFVLKCVRENRAEVTDTLIINYGDTSRGKRLTETEFRVFCSN